MRILLLIFGIIAATIGQAAEGEQIFKTNCAACHTIGKGRLVGPDLLNINEHRSEEWLISFIRSSTAMIKSGDEQANTIFKEYNGILMPDNPLSDAQIKSILEYISQGGAGTSGSESTAMEDILSGTDATNISAGALLFSGLEPFSNGGASCTSCHKVRDERIFSSGTLAKDLSESFDAMGSSGIAAIINNPPFPVMQVAYKNHPLTEAEVVDLTAYLKSVSKERIYQRPRDFSMAFAFFGLMAFVIIFMSTVILYFKRKKFPVNREILDRPSKVIN